MPLCAAVKIITVHISYREMKISEVVFFSFHRQTNINDHRLLIALSMMCGVLHWAMAQLFRRRIISAQSELLFMWSSEFT